MYQPKAHEETRNPVMHDLIRAHPLATVVTRNGSGLAVNHIPFLIDPDCTANGVLRGHVARANPMWQDTGMESVCIFQGPEAYISPNWYPGKHPDGKVVPTWNYAVVHAHGHIRAVEDPAWLLQLLTDLTNTHERAQQHPWQVGDAPPDYIARMLDMIVGIEIPIRQLTGKWKISQNRPVPDRLGVAAGLELQIGGSAMADLVRSSLTEP